MPSGSSWRRPSPVSPDPFVLCSRFTSAAAAGPRDMLTEIVRRNERLAAGATVERMRFDHKRSQILARYDEALREWHAFRIELEKTVARP